MTQLLSSSGNPSFQRVRLADVSGDGEADLLAVSQADNQAYVMINNGAGGFGAATGLGGVNAAWDISAADVDNDGHVDVGVSGGRCSATTTYGAYWFRNLGGSTPSWSSANVIHQGTPNAAQRMALGDMNNDGYIDAVVLWEQVRVECFRQSWAAYFRLQFCSFNFIFSSFALLAIVISMNPWCASMPIFCQ